jgi:glycosyltransferase involved in cell wall biosynthesis
MLLSFDGTIAEDLAVQTPLVTALITTYNSERTISEAIESCLAQTFRGFEIVVVDDGSTDGTRAVVESYGASVRYIHQPNSGSASARNVGLRAATGKYVAFLDGDDVALPDRFSIQVSALESHPRAGCAYGNFYLMDAHGRSVRLRGGTSRYRSGTVTRELAVRNFVAFSTIMARRDLLLGIGMFDESIRSSEDWDMLVRLSCRCDFLYVGQAVTKYRISPNSKTSNLKEKERAYRRVQAKIFAENDFGDDTRRLLRHSRAAVQFSLAGIGFRYGRRWKGLYYALRGCAMAPDLVFKMRHELAARAWARVFKSPHPPIGEQARADSLDN